MGLFTSIGTGLWRWLPFRKLVRHQDDQVGLVAKLIWFALYTTNDAKSALPGIFVGSVTSLAEASSLAPDVVRAGLDRLLEDDLIEWDVEARVIRMTELPDFGESPSNGRAIRGWWRRYQNIPECQVRDNHVPVLRWIIDTSFSHAGKTGMGKDHAEAWRDTFGRLKAPPPRVRRPLPFQADLFRGSGLRNTDLNNLDTNTCSTLVEQESGTGSGSGSGVPESGSGRRAVLTLVPHPAFDADDLAETLHHATVGGFPAALTREQRIALGRAIDASGEIVVRPDALDALREYVASLSVLRGAAGMTDGISLELVTSPGWIGSAIKRGIDWKAAEPPLQEEQTP